MYHGLDGNTFRRLQGRCRDTRHASWSSTELTVPRMQIHCHTCHNWYQKPTWHREKVIKYNTPLLWICLLLNFYKEQLVANASVWLAVRHRKSKTGRMWKKCFTTQHATCFVVVFIIIITPLPLSLNILTAIYYNLTICTRLEYC